MAKQVAWKRLRPILEKCKEAFTKAELAEMAEQAGAVVRSIKRHDKEDIIWDLTYGGDPKEFLEVLKDLCEDEDRERWPKSKELCRQIVRDVQRLTMARQAARKRLYPILEKCKEAFTKVELAEMAVQAGGWVRSIKRHDKETVIGDLASSSDPEAFLTVLKDLCEDEDHERWPESKELCRQIVRDIQRLTEEGTLEGAWGDFEEGEDEEEEGEDEEEEEGEDEEEEAEAGYVDGRFPVEAEEEGGLQELKVGSLSSAYLHDHIVRMVRMVVALEVGAPIGSVHSDEYKDTQRPDVWTEYGGRKIWAEVYTSSYDNPLGNWFSKMTIGAKDQTVTEAWLVLPTDKGLPPNDAEKLRTFTLRLEEQGLTVRTFSFMKIINTLQENGYKLFLESDEAHDIVVSLRKTV